MRRSNPWGSGYCIKFRCWAIEKGQIHLMRIPSGYRQPMTRLAIALVAGFALASPAAAQKTEQEMTCRGPLRGDGETYHRVGYCHINHDPAASKIVLGACKYYKPCVMRARVAPAGEPSKGVPQNYTVLKVYSARPGR